MPSPPSSSSPLPLPLLPLDLPHFPTPLALVFTRSTALYTPLCGTYFPPLRFTTRNIVTLDYSAYLIVEQLVQKKVEFFSTTPTTPPSNPQTQLLPPFWMAFRAKNLPHMD